MEPMADANNLEQAMMRRAKTQGIPLNGSLELTPLCNLNCEMCYVRPTPAQVARQGRLRTVGEWLDIATQMRDAGTLCRTCAASALLETGRYDGTPDYMCRYTAHTFRLLLDEVSALARKQKS